MNILQAIDDPKVFGAHFAKGSWEAWRAFLAALFGLALSDEGRRIYTACTTLETPPDGPASEAWLVIGRRGGKSFVLAVIAVFLACFRDWRPYLGPGERGTIMVIAADRRQARTIMRYVKGLLNAVPMLKASVESETAETVNLQNSVSIEVHTASFRTVRGYTVVAALLDEVAFWRSDESANPDTEVLNALKPAMATIPDALLLCASSPYARRGALWKAYRKHFGKPGKVLVWKADTLTMNPTVPREVIDAAYADDPASAGAEYGAEFRSDIEAFVSREVVETCVTAGVRERPRVEGVTYHAFTDPSGGSSDAFTLAVAHREGDRIVLDAVRERKPPFSPEGVIDEFCELLKAYGLRRVTGDRYGGEFPREHFRKRNIDYVVAKKVRSDLYRDLLPVLNSGRADLLDNDRLVAQLVGLERRVARGGRESIDHAPGGHDDIANSVAGAIDLCSELRKPGAVAFGRYGMHVGPNPFCGTYGRGDKPTSSNDLPPPAWMESSNDRAESTFVGRDYIRGRKH